jgi:hypothetical protein
VAKGGGHGGQEQWVKPWARTRRWPPLSECARRGTGASVQTVGLTGGPHAVLIFFQFIQNWLNFKNSKWLPYLAPKISNVCMLLAWDIIKNCLNCGLDLHKSEFSWDHLHARM